MEQLYIETILANRRAITFSLSGQMTILQLLTRLHAIEDKKKQVVFDGVDGETIYIPGNVESWRGSYRELALTYIELAPNTLTPCTVRRLISLLATSLEVTFVGYKGGEYVMHEDTPVWVANYGESHGFKRSEDCMYDNQGVVGVREEYDYVALEASCILY